MPRCVVYYAASGGLANRLRALVGYQALSRFLELPFYLCWVRNADCDADFLELFEPNLQIIEPGVFDSVDPETAVYKGTEWFHEVWREHLSVQVPRAEFIQCVRGYLDKLVPVRPIIDRVDTFASEHGLQKALGVHIRHTDNTCDFKTLVESSPLFDVNRVSTLQGFFEAIQAYVAQGTVYLATDNRIVEKVYKQRFGAQLIVYPKQYKKASFRTTSIVDALTEMLLLGRCGEILGTYFSSFSQFSAIWSQTSYGELNGKSRERSKFVDKMLAAMKSELRP